MEGEGEINTEGVCDVENPIYVAVGTNVKEGKSLLSWVLKSFSGKSICLLHVHQPTLSVSSAGVRLSSKLKWQSVKTCQEFEYQKMTKILNQYLIFLDQAGVLSGKVWIEMNNVERGIVQIITQHGVKQLVMGAAAEKYYSKTLSEPKSNKAIFVCQQAPVSCQIWFSCKGYLINTRSNNIGSQLSSMATMSSQSKKDDKFLEDLEDVDNKSKSFQCLELHEKVIHKGNPPSLMMGDIKENVSPIYSLNKSQNPSSVSLLEHKLQGEGTIHDKLEHALIEVENSKQKAFEESVRRWRAEEDAMEAMHAAEAAESLCTEEVHRRKKLEDLFEGQKQELKRMKDQHDEFLKELQMIQEQNPILEGELVENFSMEKELEEKIIQAVDLLISFKGKRDMLLIERDNALNEVLQLRKLMKENAAHFCISQFFAFSFLDIIEATQNFDPSLKIGEGRFGSVYKGIVRNVRVAIRMLPSCGSQSDLEFRREAEVLSRVRHPNIVTLIGTCTESRSLIYEYLENGSLEDHLTQHSKNRPLPWQLRLKIASEICSVLIFLHATKNSSVHGNLRTDNVLLDANSVSKLSGLGIHLLVPENENALSSCNIGNKNDLETSIYLDPELSDNGELTPESAIYSFGVVLLRLLTARSASSIVRDVACALEVGNLNPVLDHGAGNWPLEQTKQLAHLALRCCQKRLNRPDLAAEVLPMINSMRVLCTVSPLDSSSSCLDSKDQHRVPSHFLCPIFQEAMKDPYIAADGFTYEGDAIKGWLNSGHKTSPMTNLKLDHCDLLPNYALYYAIQEWQQHHS